MTCGFCGVPLARRVDEAASDFRKRRFCGRSCSVRARSAQRAAQKAERDERRRKSCLRCGKRFLPALRNDRASPYCSRTCSNRAKADRERATWHRTDRGYVTPCWVWQGALNAHGYGKVSVDGRPLQAYRWVYETHVGPIPTGMHLDHLCEQRDCVNPEHLEVVTGSENTRRSWARGRHDAKRKR